MADNGHDLAGMALEKALGNSIPGAKVKLEDLEREDGVLAKAAENIFRNNLGVLQRAMSAVEDDEHYRQLLKLARWEKPQQYMCTCAALAECRLIGDEEGIKMILDVVTAQSAGEKGGLLHAILEALTHTTFTTNYTGNKKHWWNGNGKPKDNSPIAE